MKYLKRKKTCFTSLPSDNCGQLWTIVDPQTFVDLKAAFDSVDRNARWKAMRGIGVPSVLTDLIIELHTATSARVRLETPLHTIHDHLRSKAGMCFGACTVQPSNGFHHGARQS